MLRHPSILALAGAILAGGLRAQAPAPVWETSIEALRPAVEQQPENAGLRVRLTQALLRPDKDSVHPDVAGARLKDAQGHFERVLALNPKCAVPLRVRALDAYMGRRFEQAVDEGRRLLEVTPLDTDVSRHVLKALVQLGKHDEAAAFLVEWLADGTTPSFGLIQGLLSTLLIKQEFREPFKKHLDEACAKRPQEVFLLLVRSLFFAETGRTESAWEALHEAERLGLCDIRTGARHTFVSSLRQRAPEFSQTPASYDGFDLEGLHGRVTANAGHAGLLMRHARLLDLAGRTPEALAGYDAVRKLNPGYWPAWYLAGVALLDSKEPRPLDAAGLLATARKLFPSYLPGFLREAEAWIQAGKGNEATALLAEAGLRFEAGKPSHEVFRKLAAAGDGSAVKRLVETLEKSVAADPHNVYARSHLALALFHAGRADDARATALAAEKAGLSGRDGNPGAVLFLVFERADPLAEAAADPPGR